MHKIPLKKIPSIQSLNSHSYSSIFQEMFALFFSFINNIVIQLFTHLLIIIACIWLSIMKKTDESLSIYGNYSYVSENNIHKKKEKNTHMWICIETSTEKKITEILLVYHESDILDGKYYSPHIHFFFFGGYNLA